MVALVSVIIPFAGPRLAEAEVTTSIFSNGPLEEIHLTDELRCQVGHFDNEFFEFQPESETEGDCMTQLHIESPSEFIISEGTYGHRNFSFGEWIPVSQSEVLGTGSTEDPFRVTTIVEAEGRTVSGDLPVTFARLVQTDSYVVGDESYRTDVEINNVSDFDLDMVLYRTADCMGDAESFGGIDLANGTVDCIEATTDQFGNFIPGQRIQRWRPITPGSSVIESDLKDMRGRIDNGEVFPNTCRCDELDLKGAGLSWPLTVAANDSTVVSHTTLFSPKGVDPAEVTADDDLATTTQETPVVIDVLANDTAVFPGDPVSITSEPTNGLAAVNSDSTVTYVPDEAFTGSDTFTYEVCAPPGDCAGAEVVVEVNEAAASLAENDGAATPHDAPVGVDVLANDSPLLAPGTLSVTQAPHAGSAVVDTSTDPPSIEYDPRPDFSGLDVFGYQACEPGFVEIIEPPVDALPPDFFLPPIEFFSGSDEPDEPVVPASISDAPPPPEPGPEQVEEPAAETQPATEASTAQVAGDEPTSTTTSTTSTTAPPSTTTSTTTTAPPSTTTTTTTAPPPTTTTTAAPTPEPETAVAAAEEPEAQPSAPGDCHEAFVLVEVGFEAVDDVAATPQDTPVDIAVLANDTGSTQPDSVQVTSPPLDGVALVNGDGTITYTPAPGFSGDDFFAYQACNAFGACDTAIVAVTVIESDPLPEEPEVVPEVPEEVPEEPEAPEDPIDPPEEPRTPAGPTADPRPDPPVADPPLPDDPPVLVQPDEPEPDPPVEPEPEEPDPPSEPEPEPEPEGELDGELGAISGTPESIVVFSGTGCVAGETVIVELDGEREITEADSDGDFSVELRLPDELGRFTATARCGDQVITSTIDVVQLAASSPSSPVSTTLSAFSFFVVIMFLLRQNRADTIQDLRRR